jgi:hypothetical protein
MDEFGSKICPNCFSPQLQASRFCDNCGNMFAAQLTSGGDTFSETKTFIRRQFVDTRPLFWAAILLVGTLSVFGFAQAGAFGGKFGEYISPATGQSAQFALRSAATKPSDTSEPIAENNRSITSTDPLLDSSDSVFDMGQGTSADGSPSKRRVEKASKSEPVRERQVKNLEPATDIEKQPEERAVQTPPQISEKSVITSTPTARLYVRGPLGGCYYLTASGSKRYVDRSACK